MEQDSRRTIFAFVLIFGFLYLWFQYFVPKPKPAVPGTAHPTAAVTPSSVSAVPPPSTPVAQIAAATQPAAIPVVPVAHERVETDVVKATFTSAGGTIEELELKKYRETTDRESPLVRTIPFRAQSGPPLLSWTFDVNGRSDSDVASAYAIEAKETGKLVFDRKTPEGLQVRKIYRWHPGTYLFDVIVELTNDSTAPLKVIPRTELGAHVQEGSDGGCFAAMGAPLDMIRTAVFFNGKTAYRTPAEIRTDETKEKSRFDSQQGEIQWAGFDSRYFLLAATPVKGRWTSVSMTAALMENADPRQVTDATVATLSYLPLEIKAKESISLELQLFAGPKEIGLLSAAGHELDHAIDLGDWLGPVARPILFFLRWLYSLIPNYGIAIILLTVVVRLLLFPLTHVQVKQMQKMQLHKPEMDAIRAKYKDDKEAQARETMAYMRRHKVNPMGGCLPLLAQMPILFALYRVLYNAIELRHAPFFAWIHDLSTHDPYFVLPIVLGVAMFIQQQMTPNPTADPAQQTMMKFMPVMFTFIMLKLAAGLNLYILVSTVWGIAQQIWVKRMTNAAVAQKEAARSSGS